MPNPWNRKVKQCAKEYQADKAKSKPKPKLKLRLKSHK